MNSLVDCTKLYVSAHNMYSLCSSYHCFKISLNVHVFVIKASWQWKIRLILSYKCHLFSCQAWNKTFQIINEMETSIYPLISSVYNTSFTHLCMSICPHRSIQSESNSKEKLSTQDILIFQKASFLVNSLLLTLALSVHV